jgi:hypothetical protein
MLSLPLTGFSNSWPTMDPLDPLNTKGGGQPKSNRGIAPLIQVGDTHSHTFGEAGLNTPTSEGNEAS